MAQSISDEVPNGLCRKCGFHLQNTKGKQKICVNCDIHGDQPTDERNEYGDPGHAAVMQALGSVVPPKERVATSEPKSIETADGKRIAPRVEANLAGVAKNVQNMPKGDDPIITMESALKTIQEYFASLPVNDLKQAKVLLKLRKDIDVLANKITNFLGGN